MSAAADFSESMHLYQWPISDSQIQGFPMHYPIQTPDLSLYRNSCNIVPPAYFTVSSAVPLLSGLFTSPSSLPEPL